MHENKMQGRSSQAFARNLRRLRSAVPNLTQRRLAKALGVSRSCYARYEEGARLPPAWLAVKAANYFHVSMDELFKE